MICLLKGCDSPHYAAGLCSKHYNRFRMTGLFNDGLELWRPFEEWLWSKVDKRGDKECWPWTGPLSSDGRGRIGTGGRAGRDVLAHRVVWENVNGPIPGGGPKPHGWVVMHTCDNPPCCNPAHLRLGSQRDNVVDMDTKGRRKTLARAGEDHPGAKHTQQQANAVHAALSEDTGYGSIPRIARKVGVDETFVRNIKKGRIWPTKTT